LLRRRRAVERSSRRQRQRRPNRDRRDRRRYEGLPHGRPSALLGRHVSTARRKRRPKALEALAQGRALAETRARPGGPGGDEGEKLQPQGAILQPQTAPRPQEGDHRRRRRDAAHHLPYAQGRNLLPRPRTRLPSTSKSKRPHDHNVSGERKGWIMSVKLTDAQLVMMTAAAQRGDRCLVVPDS